MQMNTKNQKTSYFLLLASYFLLLNAAAQPLQTADILFVKSSKSDFEQSINQVTKIENNISFSHIGLVEVNENGTFVWEATPQNGVTQTPLKQFIINNSIEIYLGRLKKEFQHLFPKAIEDVTQHLGKKYDFAFDFNNDEYYCSELIYKAFNYDETIFEANPMTFIEQNSNNFLPFWQTYFDDLKIPIPEGKLGLNPTGMSQSENLEFVKPYFYTIHVSPDLEIKQLTHHIYLYTSYADVGVWGRVGSNGVIVIAENEAFLIDSPMSNEKTEELVKAIKSNFNAVVTSFVAGHWHDDCVGGLDYLHSQNVETYAHKLTCEILIEKKLLYPKKWFTDSLYINFNSINIQCFYLGAGHSQDNIVFYFPAEKILFGGCLIKDLSAKNLGNTVDAVISEWGKTLEKVLQKFSEVEIIVPGHGNFGGFELIDHSQKLLEK